MVKATSFLFSLRDARPYSLNILHVSKTWPLLSVKHLKIDTHEGLLPFGKDMKLGCPGLEFLLLLHLFLFLFCLYLYTVSG